MAQHVSTETGKKTRRWWILIAIALLVIAFWIRYSTRGQVSVRIATATRGELLSTLPTNGKVEPVQNFAAYSPKAGTVKAVFVHEGEHVPTGKLLLSLDDSTAKTDVAAALAAERGAQAQLDALRHGGTRAQQIALSGDYDRTQASRAQAAATLASLQQLAKQGAASASEVAAARNQLAADDATLKNLQQRKSDSYAPIDLEHAQANVSNAKAAYAAALDVLRKENVRAPFAGTVYSVLVRPSDFVQAGDRLLQMADLKRIQIRAYFDEPEVGKLAPDQPVKVVWEALPSRVWHGHIVRMPTTIITYGTRNVGEALISVDDSDGTLLPNTNVTITVTTNDVHDALMIPREALRADDSGDYVLQLAGDRLKRVPVKIGALNLTEVQILSGLPEGTTVALSATDGSTLSNGMRAKRAQ